MSFSIKTASFDEMKIMVDWAVKEGWNPGLSDVSVLPLIDPTGFFLGYKDDKLVACISNAKYCPDYSFIGFYIVQPEYRGMGFGRAIWQHAINYGIECNTGLDGVLDQQQNYKKLGFILAHLNKRYQLENSARQFSHPNIVEVKSLDQKLLFEYDKPFFPCDRTRFLQGWVAAPHNHSIAYYDGNIKGYGVIRKCFSGYKIGPLFSDSAEIATLLFQKLCTYAEEHQKIYLDIPETNQEALLLATDFKMNPVFETVRMYRKYIPDISIDRTYGITSFEVG